MSNLDSGSRHNWRRYMEMSDESYRKVNSKSNANFLELANHNLVAGGNKELRCLLAIIAGKWKLRPRGKALDLCCGAGFMTDCLSQIGFNATGIDLNSDAIEFATRNFPDCRFFVGDATNPISAFKGENFDIILVRESHPFSRIDDIEFQMAVINRYLSILNHGGVLIIEHARFGGGMSYPSLDFQQVSQLLIKRGFFTAGPFFLALIKKIGGDNPSPFWCTLLSFLSHFIQRIFGLRIIEAYFIYKPAK